MGSASFCQTRLVITEHSDQGTHGLSVQVKTFENPQPWTSLSASFCEFVDMNVQVEYAREANSDTNHDVM